jgi:hypothetical protein
MLELKLVVNGAGMQRWFAAKEKIFKLSPGCLIEDDEKEVMNNLRKNLPCCHHSMLRLIWRERRLTPLLLLTLMVTWPPSARVLKKSVAWSGLVIA